MSSVLRYLGKVGPGVGMTSQGWRPRWNPDLANYVTAQAQREEAAELKAQAAVPPRGSRGAQPHRYPAPPAALELLAGKFINDSGKGWVTGLPGELSAAL